jgi:hypothetical protein
LRLIAAETVISLDGAGERLGSDPVFALYISWHGAPIAMIPSTKVHRLRRSIIGRFLLVQKHFITISAASAKAKLRTQKHMGPLPRRRQILHWIHVRPRPEWGRIGVRA